MSNYLFKVQVEGTEYSWQPKEKSYLYIVTTDKEQAYRIAGSYLRIGFRVSRVVCLGEQMSNAVFIGATK